MNEQEFDNDIHQNAINKGFWEQDEIIALMEQSNFTKAQIESVKSAYRAQKLMLVVSELSEAMEADRHNKRCTVSIDGVMGWTKDEDFIKSFVRNVKDTFEDECSDADIRIKDLAKHEGFDIHKHSRAKHRFNKTRPYMHNKKY